MPGEWEIRFGAQRAVVTALAGGLRLYESGPRQVVTSYPRDTDAPHSMGLPLIPWPNRLGDGRYSFAGAEHEVKINETARGNAIHGLTWALEWTVTETSPAAVEVACELDEPDAYPFRLRSQIRYELGASGLEATIRCTNTGATDLPLGVGQHPYLQAGAGTVDDWYLTLPAERVLEVDERMIPTGRELDVAGTELDFRRERRIGETRLDHAFTALARDQDGLVRVTLRPPDGPRTGLWADRGCTVVQVYTGEAVARRGLAVEPMSCPANAFQSGTGLQVVEPGATWSLRWGLDPDA